MKERSSGIEMLKIMAILIIVISHVTQSVGRDVSSLGLATDYYIDIKHATTDPSVLILALFRHFGALGNTIFFVCSAYFLRKSKAVKIKKVTYLVADIFIISVLILAGFLVSGVHVSPINILKSFLPTTFSNNWYMTAYLLFYLIHVQLNVIIENMNQKQMLKAVLLLTVLYCGFGIIKSNLLYGSDLTTFITIYFIISYCQQYMKNFTESRKYNRILLVIGIAGVLFLFLLTDIAGLKVNALSGKLLHWNCNNNLFIIMISLALLNLVRKHDFVNPIINYISGLSFMIYIIHENILIAAYFRPYIWHMLYQKYGHSLIIVQTLVFSVVLLVVAILLSMLYRHVLMKPVHWVTDRISTVCSKIAEKMMNLILSIH